MGKLIQKKHRGRIITIGELSIKKNHNKEQPNQTVLVFKVFHGKVFKEEDLFIFHFSKSLNSWCLNLNFSLISLNMLSNSRLLDEVYCHFKPNQTITIDEFTELLTDNFDIFIEGNTPTRRIRTTIADLFKRIFSRN